MKKKDQKKLEQMTNHEYSEFCKLVIAFEFCDRTLQWRMEFDSMKNILKNFTGLL